MNPPNENPKQIDNMGPSKEQTSCCASDCACHSTGPAERIRWVLGVIVLLIAATLVARAVVKNHGRSAEPTEPVFMTLGPATPAGGLAPANRDETADTTRSGVGEHIASLSELNTIGRANDAVFVYVPGKEGASGNPPVAALQSAASRIASQGYKIALFTLRAGSRDHEQLAAQMSLPGVLALVKGKGMSAVSGEITETKLIQGFVAAGNCGPGGCGPAGCCPTGSQ
jgi:hypothetical protein